MTRTILPITKSTTVGGAFEVGPTGHYEGEPHDGTWASLDMVTKGKNRYPEASTGNAVRILELDPRWEGRIVHDTFFRLILVGGKEVHDETETEIGLWMSDIYGVNVSEARIHQAVCAVAARHEVNPVREWLLSLKWDEVGRVDAVPSQVLGCEDTPLSRAMFRKFMVSAVSRAMEPGCKVDTVLVLVGAQGCKKSTFFAKLCGSHWFSDTPCNPTTKDALEQLAGAWIYELSELSTIKRAEQNGVKSFLSALQDRYRPSYGRNTVTYKRSCVFVGTTNDNEFLTDPTGSRRYWPLRVGEIDIPKLEEWREQLWAESVLWWKQGERVYLDGDQEKERQADSEQHQQRDVWHEDVAEYVLNRGEVSTRDILSEACKLPVEKMSRLDDMRISAIMRALGWSSKRTRKGGIQVRVWTKAAE